MNKEEMIKLKAKLFDDIYKTFDKKNNYVDLLAVKISCTTYNNIKEFSEVEEWTTTKN